MRRTNDQVSEKKSDGAQRQAVAYPRGKAWRRVTEGDCDRRRGGERRNEAKWRRMETKGTSLTSTGGGKRPGIEGKDDG